MVGSASMARRRARAPSRSRFAMMRAAMAAAMPVRAYDARVTEIDDAAGDEATKAPPPDATPATPSPGERRLARPPSDRYREAEAATAAAEAQAAVDPGASVGRGVALAAAVAISGAAAIVFLG